MISSAPHSVNQGNDSPAAPKDSTSHCGRYVLRAVVGVAVVVSIVALAVFASPWTGGTSLAVGAFALCHVSTLLAPTVAACAGAVATVGGGVALFFQSRGSQSSEGDFNDRGSVLAPTVAACAGADATIGGGVCLFSQSRGSQSSVGDSNERGSLYHSCDATSFDEVASGTEDEDPRKKVVNFFEQMAIFKENPELLTSIVKDLQFPLNCKITSIKNGELKIEGLDPIGLKVDLTKEISPEEFYSLNRQESCEHLSLLIDKPTNPDVKDPKLSPTLGNLKYFGSLGPKLWAKLKGWSTQEPSQLLDPSNPIITLTIDSTNSNRLRLQGLSEGLQNVIDTVDFDSIGCEEKKYCKISVNKDATVWQPVYWSAKDNYIVEDLLKLITLTKV
ncbi:MAG: hypothetical protein WCG14_06820 [Chlamydiia bacterium]